MALQPSTRKSGNTPVVMISGGTGVGTSTLARVISPIIGARGVIGTDIVRESLRAISDQRYSEWEGAFLRYSTYTAWKALRSDEKKRPKEKHVIAGFHRQSELVMEAVLGAVYRALSEGFPLIVEGVNIIFDRLIETEVWKLYSDRIFRVLLDCRDAETHKSHFVTDDKYSNRANPHVYLDNWAAIRAICRDLSHTPRNADLILDSSRPPSRLLEEFGISYFTWRMIRGRDSGVVSYAGRP